MPPCIPITPSHVSVNRVHIVDLPGLSIDDEVRGQSAYHLLSSRAIIRYAWERAEALQLPVVYAQDTHQTRLELPRFVDECLSSPRKKVRAAAQAIGRRLGRNLGHILLTLRRGDAVNREARPDWTDRDWDHWAGIEKVWLGGGLMSGRLGREMVGHTRAFLTEVGYEGQPRVAQATCPGVMTLLGAGRYLPATTCHAPCLDFGHTLVKRACLGFEQGTLNLLHRHTPVATDLDWLDAPRAPNSTNGRRVLDFVAAIIARTLNECLAKGSVPDTDLMLSVAAYVQDGQLLGNGLYANLSTLADDVRPLLAEAVRARTGQDVRVHLIHDGTAAGAVHAGEPNTAVLLVGTALGIGFPPPDVGDLRPLAPTLELS